jgi:membrane AbrB-like protein
LRWAALLLLSLIFSALLQWLHLPAAFFVGPMLAGVVVAVLGGSVKRPKWMLWVAQALIGLMIARGFTPQIWSTIAEHWLLFPLIVLAAIAASALLGWSLARMRVLPGSTAIWGTSPGAATAMTLMAESYDADVQLVAFMQYLRVMAVALSASLFAHFWGVQTGASVKVDWLPFIHWPALSTTLVLACGAAYLGRVFKIPAGPLLLSLISGAALQGTGLLRIELPPLLLVASYLIVGWHIGLGFTPAILAHAAQALPKIASSILILIALCGGLAWLLHRFADVEPLTAFLATSPGGADSIAIIAASSTADLPFVMALQSVRLLIVIFMSPRLARVISDLSSQSDGKS